MNRQAIPDWYDDWKTTPPDDPFPDTHCIICGKPLFLDWYGCGDWETTLDGDVCYDCLPAYEEGCEDAETV